MEEIRVTLVSHSYLAKENRKKLSALSEKVRLEVVSPSSMQGAMFSYNYCERLLSNDSWTLRLYRRFDLPFLPSQYLLSSLRFNLVKFQPHIIHIEYDPWIPVFLQVLFARQIFRKSARIVCTIKQNTYTEYNRVLSVFKDWVARQSIQSVERFIAVNKGAASIYQSRFGVAEDKFEYITQLGVDVDLFPPPTSSEKLRYRQEFPLGNPDVLVGYCGRIIEDKGIRELIEGVREARRVTGLNVGLALLGDGALKERLASEEESTYWLQMLPVVPHDRVSTFLKCLDVFVLPSRIRPYHVEHDAHALLEALSTGLPCIGTTSGVIPEILEGVGVVVEPEDPGAIAEALVTMIQNHHLQARFGRDGRERIVNLYSNEAVASMTYAVYKKVLEQ